MTPDALCYCQSCRGGPSLSLQQHKIDGTYIIEIRTAAGKKAPGFGDRRKAMLEDIAILAGGTMVSADLGIKLENVTVNMLGRAKKVMIDKENTTIVSGACKKADIQGRIAQIKTQIEVRLAKLSGGVAGHCRVGEDEAAHASRRC